jgi:hypothetical protein
MLENKYLQIHPTMDKLVTALRSAWAKDGVLDKEVTSYDDILDAMRGVVWCVVDQGDLEPNEREQLEADGCTVLEERITTSDGRTIIKGY